MTDGNACDPLIGSMVNNYRIDALLAQGGMGAVYLARDAALPSIRKVIKVLLPEFANSAHMKERFVSEAEAVSLLRHQKIVGIDGIGTLADGRMCMVIPFLEGKPLDQFIAEHGGRLLPHQVMHILAHIADALDHAHGKGIIHRDLKPGNVFVEVASDDICFCKVIDFGIAKQLRPRVRRISPTIAAPTGTVGYMPVEQYVSPSDVTPAADIFALAVMMWEMLTGQLPWGQHDSATLYQKQLQEALGRPAGNYLSPEWEELLREALSPDPRLRPQSVRQLVLQAAWRLPAHKPLHASGVEILAKSASHLLNDNVPDSATPASLISSSSSTVRERRGMPPHAPAPAVPSARVNPSHLTTLGSSTGTIESPARARRQVKRALLGVAAAGAVCVGTLLVVAVRGSIHAAAEVRQRAENSILQPTPSVPVDVAHPPAVPIDVHRATAPPPEVPGNSEPTTAMLPAMPLRSIVPSAASRIPETGPSRREPKLRPANPDRLPARPRERHIDPDEIGGQEGD